MLQSEFSFWVNCSYKGFLPLHAVYYVRKTSFSSLGVRMLKSSEKYRGVVETNCNEMQPAAKVVRETRTAYCLELFIAQISDK